MTTKISESNIRQATLDALSSDSLLTLATARTASGTAVEFTDIPSWVKRITVMYSGISLSGTSAPIIQLGSSGGTYVTSGYLGTATTGAGTSTSMSAGFTISSATAGPDAAHGTSVLTTLNGLIWTYNSIVAYSNQAATRFAAGSVTMTNTIDRIRIRATNGTDTFDAGSINIMYE